jgi:PAS domain-containing protein
MTPVRQRNVALILARELAVNLATPMWVWDEDGTLVYYNDHVARLFGALHSELGIERLSELSRLQPVDLDGNAIPPDELPSPTAIRERRPEHRDLRITGLDGVTRTLTVTAFPLFARGGEFVGAMSVFWERDS